METELRRVQLRELKILKDVIAVCDRYQLRYFAIGGTCLGAVRHKGFIPWDDDIDLAMPRKDYEAFRKIALSGLPEGAELYDEVSGRHNRTEWLKVHDPNSILVVKEDYPYKDRYTGVFVDIMHLDGLPDVPAKQKRHIRKAKCLLKLNTHLRFAGEPVYESVKGRLLHALISPLNAVLPWDYFHKKYDRLVRKYDFDRSGHTYFSWSQFMEKRVFPRSLFDGCLLMDFEDIKIRVPAGYDEYLKIHYGDYKKLPPESERKTTHRDIVVDLEHSYREYREGRLELNTDGYRLHGGSI